MKHEVELKLQAWMDDEGLPGKGEPVAGRAVDLQDQLGELTFESPGYLWLAANAGKYGFFQPPSVAPGGANEEAWHWETQV